MKNYGHRFATGVISVFYISLMLVFKNCLKLDFFKFCERIPILNKSDILLFAVIFCFIFPQSVFLDKISEKYFSTEEQRDKMYFSIMGVSIFISVLSFVI